MWGVTAGAIALCSRKVKATLDDRKVPLMGVVGAFVFAAQMINFAIPGTGASGHLGGGMILAILLGPAAAFITMASVLTVQSLFFADGGLLALGCNIFNLGFFPCFIAYPLIYRPIAGSSCARGRILTASLISSVLGLQLGAFSVVLETVASGVSALPFSSFALVMLPIHLAIGVGEGVATAAVISFVAKSRPEILTLAPDCKPADGVGFGRVALALLVAAMMIGGALSWYASSRPDGLEWAIAKVAGVEEVEAGDFIHRQLAGLQEKVAVLPDYGFRSEPESSQEGGRSVDAGKSVAGVAGGGLTLLLAFGAGALLKRRRP